MESWMPDRVHRLKNILAFLSEIQGDLPFTHYETFTSLSPTIIESLYLRFLGPDLPTVYEYSTGMTPRAELILNDYLSKWSPRYE